jgi:hypothetical protein
MSLTNRYRAALSARTADEQNLDDVKMFAEGFARDGKKIVDAVKHGRVDFMVSAVGSHLLAVAALLDGFGDPDLERIGADMRKTAKRVFQRADALKE